MLIGLAWRVAGAQGALWLDEAWSVSQAREVGTPLGLFLTLHHDNNHHLNSLWLLIVGVDAPPLLMRALAIGTGTAAIWVAALVAAPGGRAAMLMTAWLFALSPLLVTLGSEARGYAPMALALLGAIRLVDRSLADGVAARDRRLLGWCVGLGVLAQLTMVFAMCALTGWYGAACWRRDGLRPAIIATVRLFAPALSIMGAILALIAVPAALSPDGFVVGRYDPFGWRSFAQGVSDLVAYACALPAASPVLIAAPLAVAGLLAFKASRRPAFYLLAIAAFPATVAVLRLGNAGFARYYLLTGIALLLVAGEWLASGWARGGLARTLAAAVLALFTIGATVENLELATNRRGDVGPAIAALRARAPTGASVALDRPASEALLAAAARLARYPLVLRGPACPPARFRFADRPPGVQQPRAVRHCGMAYRPIAHGEARGPSGTDWTLWERAR